MENVAGRITVFHNLYLACLAAALLLFCISLVLFIRLDIRGVIGFFTGQDRTENVQIRKVDDLPGIMITKKLDDGTEEIAEILKTCDTEEEKTQLLQQTKPSFYIEREILLIHTDETVE